MGDLYTEFVRIVVIGLIVYFPFFIHDIVDIVAWVTDWIDRRKKTARETNRKGD